MVIQVCDYTKTTAMYKLKRWNVLYVNYISMKLLKRFRVFNGYSPAKRKVLFTQKKIKSPWLLWSCSFQAPTTTLQGKTELAVGSPHSRQQQQGGSNVGCLIPRRPGTRERQGTWGTILIEVPLSVPCLPGPALVPFTPLPTTSLGNSKGEHMYRRMLLFMLQPSFLICFSYKSH